MKKNVEEKKKTKKSKTDKQNKVEKVNKKVKKQNEKTANKKTEKAERTLEVRTFKEKKKKIKEDIILNDEIFKNITLSNFVTHKISHRRFKNKHIGPLVRTSIKFNDRHIAKSLHRFNVNKQNILNTNVKKENKNSHLNFVDKLNTKIKTRKEISENKIDEVPQNERKRPKAKKITLFFSTMIWICIICTAIVGICGLYVAKNMLSYKPELNVKELIAPDSTLIYDAKGNVIAELGEYRRENIDYEEMPNVLIDAFLSIEDSRYFTHIGFDLPRFVKAALENLKSGGFGQGGSTFTMQLIKNVYFQKDAGENSTMAEKKISRKLQEIILAIEATNHIDKKQIFTDYINRINFGDNIRGIQKAADFYFNKDARELNLSESAFLAGIINSPTIYNPYNDLAKDNPANTYLNAEHNYLEYGQKRRDEVLNMMVYHGYISENEANIAKSINLADQIAGHKDKWEETSNEYQDYIDAVVMEVKEVYGKDPYYTSMNIYTNMIPEIQSYVYDIQNNNTHIRLEQNNMQSAIVSMNNQTGAIIALGGGKQTEEEGEMQWNRATMSKIQPGSTVKPVLDYLLAFDQLGWATSHTIVDNPYFLYGQSKLPLNNYNNQYHGEVTIMDAVCDSQNIPAIKALEAVVNEKGEEFVVNFLNDIGIPTKLEDFDLQYAYGGSTLSTSPVQVAGMHSILFNGGRYIKPHTVNRIVYPDDTEVISDTKGNQVVKPGAAFMAAQLERYVMTGPYYNGTNAFRRNYPIYAKTGTTDWGKDGVRYGIPVGAAKDHWVCASTSEYTNVVWVGFDKAAPGAYFWRFPNSKFTITAALLDKIKEVTGYNPTTIPQPNDITTITHIKGVFPYCSPVTGTPTTGYILKEFAKLHNINNVKIPPHIGTFDNIKANMTGDFNVNVSFELSKEVEDLSTKALDGTVKKFFGKKFYTGGEWKYPEGPYYAEVYVNDKLEQSGSIADPNGTITLNISYLAKDVPLPGYKPNKPTTPEKPVDPDKPTKPEDIKPETVPTIKKIEGSIKVCGFSKQDSEKKCINIQ